MVYDQPHDVIMNNKNAINYHTGPTHTTTIYNMYRIYVT